MATAPNSQLDDYIRQNYGYMAWALQVPELRSIFEDVVQNHSGIIDQSTLQGKLYASEWWKTHSDAQKAYVQLKAERPAEYKSRLLSQLATVKSYAGQMGVPISSQRARQLAADSMYLGWTDAELHSSIGLEYHYDPKNPVTANATVQALKNYSAEMAMPMSTSTINNWTRSIVGGRQTTDNFRAYLTAQAKKQFNDPDLQKALDEGMTVQQYLDPSINKVAGMLGINADTIQLQDGKWNKLFLQTRNQQGQLQVPTLDQIEQQIKTDSQGVYGYDHSQNGLTDSAQLTQQLGQMMGVLK